MEAIRDVFAGWLPPLGQWWSLIESVGILSLAVVGGMLLYAAAFRLFRRWAAGTPFRLDDLLAEHLRKPARLAIPLFFVHLAIPSLPLSAAVRDTLRHATSLVVIATMAWIAIAAILVLRDLTTHHFDVSVPDNLRARAVQTQVRVAVRVAVVIVCLIATASMLMTFEKIRQVGVSILASAGIIGVIVGFAAQKSIATLFAGIQIAITQPIRIDDVVIVEGEWGRIEEITLTYVVVRIWDLRRLVVPITYFIEKPFQNWTRISADLLGTVFLYADYTVPVERVREELHRVLEESTLWDGKVWGLVVTDAKERTVEMRALMSAADSSAAWNLRCEVRERLLAFLQRNYPESLPRVRAEVHEQAPPPGQPP